MRLQRGISFFLADETTFSSFKGASAVSGPNGTETREVSSRVAAHVGHGLACEAGAAHSAGIASETSGTCWHASKRRPAAGAAATGRHERSLAWSADRSSKSWIQLPGSPAGPTRHRALSLRQIHRWITCPWGANTRHANPLTVGCPYAKGQARPTNARQKKPIVINEELCGHWFHSSNFLPPADRNADLWNRERTHLVRVFHP
jgi:hypothetical protein